MKARGAVVGVLGAGAMVLAGQTAASANIAWCMFDPPAQVQTVDGTALTINTQVYVPKSEVHDLRQVTETTSTSPDATGTLITVNVTLPPGITSARIVTSVNRYGVSASASGTGGETVTLQLEVPTS